jgi:formyl-CoA transferase
MDLLLADVRVLDFGQVIAGPLCACFLGHFGADVITVEPPDDGELVRPDDLDAAAEEYEPRTIDGEPFSPSFEPVNPNERSLTVDLKTDGG